MFQKRGEPRPQRGFFARHTQLMAACTLVGTIVGAGILGLPYVIAKAGFIYGLFLILGLGAAFLMLHLFLGEIVLRTKKQHQLSGYAEKYLGSKGKKIMTFSMLVSIYGALTAYLIGEGEALRAIFHWGHPLMYTLIFFLVGFFIIYQGIKATGKAELILIVSLILITILIGIFSYNNLNYGNLKTINPAFFFLPYGVVLFALMGLPGVPEMQEIVVKDKQKLKKAILFGSLIPVAMYILFVIIIMGLVGLDQFEALKPNERIATVALSIYAHPILGIFANILAVLAMFTSFLTLGTALLEMYQYDYNVGRIKSLFLVFTLPLIIAVLNLATFLKVLGITGAISGGLDGILVTLMYWQAKKKGDRKPEYELPLLKTAGWLVIFLFALGIIYTGWVNLR